MYVTSGNDREIQATIEAALDLANALSDGDVDAREVLARHGFARATSAPEAAVRRTVDRMRDLLPRIQSLPDSSADAAAVWVNAELTELAIAPSLTEHDGADLHIHWTPSSATFDDQVMADVLMAIAQDLCDQGTTRFGRCGAADCEHLFYDTTRNGSRRFCADPRCASRTHTADHRSRRRSSRKS